jgi:carboxyl-terminal processing protease
MRWLTLVSALTLGLWGAQSSLPNQAQIVEQVWGIINRAYLDPTFNHRDWNLVQLEAMSRNIVTRAETDMAIDAMLRPLDDPLTRHMTAEELASTFDQATGKLGGIGVTDPWLIQDQASGPFRILHVVAASPAWNSGVLPGDIIAAIDGKPAAGLSHDEILTALAGPPGTSISLKLQRGNKTIELTILRELLSLHTVRTSLRTESGKRVGYIGLNQFAPGSPGEMRRALNNFLEENVDGIVLDLRNNPGGLVSASREIAGFFLNREVIYFSVERTGSTKEWWASGVRITDKPIVVLVNGATASAAEILAAALIDNHRAIAVGTRTYGQGLVHAVERLSDGSGLVYAIAYFKTPGGLDVRRRGILPNIMVEAPETGAFPQDLATPKDIQCQRSVAALLGIISPAASKADPTGHRG